MKNLDAIKQHGDVIWNIANPLRGPYRPPQCRRVMTPLTAATAGKTVVRNWQVMEKAA